MALTYKQLLDRLAEMEGKVFADWSEAQKAQRVPLLNEALRWAWKTNDRMMAFPFTVATGTITVVSGIVPKASLGDATWCSLWSEDPRAASSRFTARKIYATTSHEGPAPVTEESSVFAFYRKVVPAGTYASGGNYATPADIPDELLDMVPLRALSSLFVALQQFDALNALKAVYGDPRDTKEGLVAGVLNSDLIWNNHVLALAPA